MFFLFQLGKEKMTKNSEQYIFNLHVKEAKKQNKSKHSIQNNRFIKMFPAF